MPTKIFVLGLTGYVGGTVIQKLLSSPKHNPDNFDITALIRTDAKASKIKSAYPNIRTVIGDLDSADVIAEESAKADIILSAANCDHEGHIKSIYAGQAKHSGTAYLIHTSGTGILTDPKLAAVGKANQTASSDREYDDVKDIKAITTLPDENLHRLVDRLVLETAPGNVKQLIVCPPLIYGKGSGPDNTGSIQVPQLVEAILQRGRAFVVGEGKGIWSNVHVQDLVDLYVLLIEEALKEGGGKASWGPEGYYFAENGRHSWLELSQHVAKVAKEKGLIKTEEIEHLPKDEVKIINSWGPYQWGTNSKSKATRAREQLGWKPNQPSLWDTIPEVVELAKTKA